MAAPTLGGYKVVVSGTGLTTTVDPAVPTGGSALQTDDWMIVVFHSFGLGSITAPAGWENVTALLSPGTSEVRVFAKKRLFGETSYVFTQDVTNVRCIAMFWIQGADEYVNWVIGAAGLRAVTGTSFTNVAPSITVPADCLVLNLSAERTTADELADPTVDVGTKWFVTQGNIDEGIFVSYETPAAGATGTRTTTYPNTQASNGVALLVGIPSPAAPPSGLGYPVDVTTDGIGTTAAGFLAVYDGVESVPSVFIEVMPEGVNLAALVATPDFRIAHRGGGKSWPEMTMHAYTQAVHAGAKALEVSVHKTTDGVWAMHHDTTTLRMTGVDLTINAVTFADLAALETSAADTSDPGQPTRPIGRLEELFDAYLSTHTIFLDVKAPSVANMDAILVFLDSYGAPTDRVVFKNFYTSTTPALRMKTEGYTTWGYCYDEEIDIINLAAWDMIGLNYDALQADWDTAVGYGRTTIAHVLGQEAQVAGALAKGADGLMISVW